MKYGVSACLLGINCKYNGKNNESKELIRALENHEIVPICPECTGGLPIPRVPCERKGNQVISKEGEDKTFYFEKGAQLTLETIQKEKVDALILQSRSPSCGVLEIYDGSFSNKLIKGQGVFVQKCMEANIPCFDVKEWIKHAD
ncbi:DUF523 domain-containing protein [Floccifex sp.]|uniref:DUF523 domain-containing protein n=1 Tax=Floccifex sp. TaxID=2815810 RepID=UPI003F07C8DA